MTTKEEIEFFKLAGFMLLSRFQVVNGDTCVEVNGHCKKGEEPLYTQLSYLGYSDAAREMMLLLKEIKNGRSSS